MRRNWTREETLLALRLYCQESFGRLHQNNPEIQALAESIGRTASAVAMKACNFANLDEALPQKGLKNCSDLDRALWEKFQANSEEIAAKCEHLWSCRVSKNVVGEKSEDVVPLTELTEKHAITRVRRVQGFFRRSLLASYEGRCAISDVEEKEFLIASHIIPWSVNESLRANPRNGILLNAYYDKAFDSGFITFDKGCRLVVSSQIKETKTMFHKENLLSRVGQRLRMPEKLRPLEDALDYHRNKIFIQ